MNDTGSSMDNETRPAPKKTPFALRIFAVICILIGVQALYAAFISSAAVIVAAVNGVSITASGLMSVQALVLWVMLFVLDVALAALNIAFGIRILAGRLRWASRLALAMLFVDIPACVVGMMVVGVISFSFIFHFCIAICLIALHIYLDPTLVQERREYRRQQKLQNRADQLDGTLGRDKTGKGYIKLNFFNLFWIFLLASFLGWLFEMIVCPFLNGCIQDRTGLLWGPFSPIYGVGATLMTMALNRIYNKNPLLIFLVSAVVGAGVEFGVSFIFEYAFGIFQWNYENGFLNLQGRTDLFHAICWGVMGVIFIRWTLPLCLKVINRIPWNWRYALTLVVAVLMFVDFGMTMLSFDFWYLRSSDTDREDTAMAQFYDENFGNDFMAEHFPYMGMYPKHAVRIH